MPKETSNSYFTWFPGGRGKSGGSCESAGGEADWGCAASAQVGPGAAWASMADTSTFLCIYFCSFSEGREKYGIDLRTWLRYFLGRDVERDCQNEATPEIMRLAFSLCLDLI